MWSDSHFPKSINVSTQYLQNLNCMLLNRKIDRLRAMQHGKSVNSVQLKFQGGG